MVTLNSVCSRENVDLLLQKTVEIIGLGKMTFERGENFFVEARSDLECIL